MATKTIVILGAGVGGIVVANELRRLVRPEHHIVLIEKNSQHAFAPSFLWLMTGDRRPEKISREVKQLLHKGVELLHSEARGIDLAAHREEARHDAPVDLGRKRLHRHRIGRRGADGWRHPVAARQCLAAERLLGRLDRRRR